MTSNDGESKSARSRFLSKSKWGKVFKESDSPAPPGHVNSFKLNDDVADFLRPSTEKAAARPKINVAVAQRWPDAHEVRRLPVGHAGPGVQASAPVFTKPPRRRGLRVAFVKTTPEIMGEGGDESLDPPSEISRMKVKMQRSSSDRHPGTGESAHWAGIQPLSMREPTIPNVTEDGFRPQPLRRANTSYNEVSASLQRKHMSPPLEDMSPHRPSLGRTPTGFSSLGDGTIVTPDTPLRPDERPFVPSQAPASFQTNFPASHRHLGPTAINLESTLLPNPEQEPVSPATRKQRNMDASEGMALRRASAMIMTGDNEHQVRQDATTGFQPPAHFYNTLSAPSAPDVLREVSPTRGRAQQDLSPESAVSTSDTQSPFADPRYLGHHSEAPSSTSVARAPEHSRSNHQPSYMRYGRPEAQSASIATLDQSPTPHDVDNARQITTKAPQSYSTQLIESQPSYMRTAPPQTQQTNPVPFAGQTASSVVGGGQLTSRSRDPSPMGGHTPDRQVLPGRKPVNAQHIAPGRNASHAPSMAGHRPIDRDLSPPAQVKASPAKPPSTTTTSTEPHDYDGQYTTKPPASNLLGPGAQAQGPPSPSHQLFAQTGYFTSPGNSAPQPARSPAAILRQEDVRPGSSGSARSSHRLAASPQSDPASDNAFADFAARVAHMKGVFRLTAAKERPADTCPLSAWLRTALWWYLRGKLGLEMMLQHRARSKAPPQELLTQPHVDLAKSWWILSEPLESTDDASGASPVSARSTDSLQSSIQLTTAMLRSYLKSLCLQMLRNQLMPPPQSLIQGQDTTIWLDYPHFNADAAAVMGGDVGRSPGLASPTSSARAVEALPLGDSRNEFCYGRFPVDASVNTDEASTDRVNLSCMLTMLRGKGDYQTSFLVSSQSELINVRVSARGDGMHKNPTWEDVSWKSNSRALVIRLSRGYDLTVHMHERDYRTLGNIVEYARKVDQSQRAEPGEHLIHESSLSEMQYATSSSPSPFPPEKIKGCAALVFEKTITHRDASGMRKMHDGFRILLITDPSHKSLSSVSHVIGRQSPFCFELLTDAAANGTTAMVIRSRENSTQSRSLLVFPDAATRQALYDALTSTTVRSDETIVRKMAITSMDIQAAYRTNGMSPQGQRALQQLKWSRLGVTNSVPDDATAQVADTVESENLRIIARHAAGCITDRLNLGKGEMLMRLTCASAALPSMQILRNPQQDLSIAVDTRAVPTHISDGMAELLALAQRQATIRQFTFASLGDLHLFQMAITGFTVRYDGVASTLGISRRMMVVPIHHKWQASRVRLQVVSKSSIVQVLAFMEDFEHADSLCFRVKSTDVFETVKGDGKGKKWAVKLKDAKFSLPEKDRGEGGVEDMMRRRFVNLEGLDYAVEHDDITVGFDTEEERDTFAQALPAAATIGRGITLKRRI